MIYLHPDSFPRIISCYCQISYNYFANQLMKSCFFCFDRQIKRDMSNKFTTHCQGSEIIIFVYTQKTKHSQIKCYIISARSRSLCYCYYQYLLGPHQYPCFEQSSHTIHRWPHSQGQQASLNHEPILQNKTCENTNLQLFLNYM